MQVSLPSVMAAIASDQVITCDGGRSSWGGHVTLLASRLARWHYEDSLKLLLKLGGQSK